jgi:CBS domain-containing protein
MDSSHLYISAQATIRNAMNKLDAIGLRTLIVAEENRLIGTLTDGDIRRFLLKGGKLEDALDAAVKTWNEGEFADDSLELVTDAPFAAAYEAIVATGKAWGEVYVNPTELRETIEAHNYDAKMFPIGKNPGE